MDFLYVVCLSLVLWARVEAQQFDENSCTDLLPSGATNLDIDPLPFLVAATSTSYTPGESTVNVFLATATSVDPTDIIIQARTSPGNIPVGSFDLLAGFRYAFCAGSAEATLVTVDTSPPGLPIPFTWTPPSVGVGPVVFEVSLVDVNNNAWSRVPSAVVNGPLDPLTIDPCPVPSVSGTTAVFSPPTCRRATENFVSTCDAQPGTFPSGDTTVTCTCFDGGETVTCDFTVTVIAPTAPCNPDPCQNGGQCFEVPSFPNGYFCNCVGVFTGQNCQDGGTTFPLSIEPCPPTINNAQNNYFWNNPNCFRNGNVVSQSTCTPSSGGTFTGPINPVTCTCIDDGEVASCPFNINAGPVAGVCLTNPCLAGAECREAETTLAGYTCHSSTGLPCV